MKKIISITTILCMILILSACGSKEETLNTNVTIYGKTILNNNKIKLSVKRQSFGKGEIVFDVQNKTKKNLKSGILKSLVNNITLDNTSGQASIDAKKTSTINVKFNKQEMKNYNIGEVSSIALSIVFIDDEYNEVVNTGYFQLKTSSDYIQDIDGDGEEIFSEKKVSVYFKDKEIKDGQIYWNVQIKNESTKPYFVNIGDAKINKAEFKSTFIYDTIPANSLSYKKLIIGKNELSEYHIKASKLGDLQVAISVYDVETYEKVAEQTKVLLK